MKSNIGSKIELINIKKNLKNKKKNIGLSTRYLSKLAKNCLKVQPGILPCDFFKSKSRLIVGRSFIVNLQKSWSVNLKPKVSEDLKKLSPKNAIAS